MLSYSHHAQKHRLIHLPTYAVGSTAPPTHETTSAKRTRVYLEESFSNASTTPSSALDDRSPLTTTTLLLDTRKLLPPSTLPGVLNLLPPPRPPTCAATARLGALPPVLLALHERTPTSKARNTKKHQRQYEKLFTITRAPGLPPHYAPHLSSVRKTCHGDLVLKETFVRSHQCCVTRRVHKWWCHSTFCAAP